MKITGKTTVEITGKITVEIAGKITLDIAGKTTVELAVEATMGNMAWNDIRNFFTPILLKARLAG